MEILDLEQKYIELKSALNELTSKRKKLLIISDYLSFVLPNVNFHFIEAYIIELIPDYLLYIQSLEIRGLNPKIFTNLQSQLKIILELNFADVSKDDISKALVILDEKIRLLNSWLNNEHLHRTKAKIYFPVLEKNRFDFETGYLESINIEIKNGEQKFHISPSEYENDEQLEKQVQLCYDIAINYCKKFIHKIKPTHTVYLHFENRLGIYTGNSLGIALSLALIEAILRYYNSATVVNFNQCVAFTGGISRDSKIISTSKAIIESKLETVFYSEAQIFCVPKIDELWAQEKLLEFLKNYPHRSLKIIGLTDLDDLLDRRQIVEIRKQKLAVRSAKFVKKNWISAFATVLLAILFGYMFVLDWDDNPQLLTSDGNNLFVKNKSGKILWTKHIESGGIEISNTELLSIARIIDIDGDRVNEVLLTQKFDDKTLKLMDYSSVYCFDKMGKIIWTYEFKDKVISNREDLKPDYTVNIVDTLTIYSKENLLLISKNLTSYSSAIFRINLRTGKRLPGTIWTAGHIMGGEIKDIDKDGKKEFMGTGYDNGYEDVVFWGCVIDSLLKMRPTREEYFLRNMSIAEMKVYIRFPKIDYDYYKQIRTPTLISANFSDNQSQGEYRFSVGENGQVQIPNLSYKISYNFKDIDVIITSGFRVKRDSLVSQGKLNLPFTDTDAYKKIILDNILYWKDSKWVNRTELFKYE